MATGREILALHRYFIWANKMRTLFDESIVRRGIPNESRVMIEPYMFYWYAGLFVVIEGWRHLGMADETIDALLQSPNVDLLRRYRNGVFHFQQEYYDSRFLQFIADGTNCVEWIRTLNQEFGRYFLTREKAAATDDKSPGA